MIDDVHTPAGPATRAPSTRPVVRCDGMSRTYAGRVPVRALAPTDLVIETGTYTAVVGPSGSGKSTLLNLLGLLDRPDMGEYHLDGLATTTLPDNVVTVARATRIGFVFQQFHLIGTRTVSSNVQMGLLYGRGLRSERHSRVQEALARVGMSHRTGALAATLSGGEAQRVAIARAIVRAPRLLLADEPTGNLDSHNSNLILDVIDELRLTLGLTVVIVTHDMQVAAHADHRIEVVDGVVRW